MNLQIPVFQKNEKEELKEGKRKKAKAAKSSFTKWSRDYVCQNYLRCL